ncbi:MAG: hypothetical protein AABX29_00425 [Nanoarchaeota archaeon]
MVENDSYREQLVKRDVFLPSNVELTIRFTKHNTREDLGLPGELKSRLKNTDIFVPEYMGIDEAEANLYKKISRGYTSPHQVISYFPDFGQQLLEELHRSYVNLAFVDVEFSDPFISSYLANRADLDIFFTGGFDGALQETAEKNKRFMELNAVRERIILSRIGPALQEVIDKNPKFKSKKRVHVLMLIGAIHQNIYQELVQVAHQQRSETTDDTPSVLVEGLTKIEDIGTIDYQSRLNMHYSPYEFRLTDEELTESLIKAVGSILITQAFPWLTTQRHILNEIINLLSTDETRSLYETFREFDFSNYHEHKKRHFLRTNPTWLKIEDFLEDKLKYQIRSPTSL